MALGGEIVDLGGLHFLNDANEISRIGHIAVVQKEFYARPMGVLIKMIDALGVE